VQIFRFFANLLIYFRLYLRLYTKARINYYWCFLSSSFFCSFAFKFSI